MKIDNLDRIAEMVVCPACRDVVGWFYRLYGVFEGQGPLRQEGRCVLHLPRPDAPTWPRFDFNRGVDLCRCCGIEPLASGSRWSVWFCGECKEQVGLLNARHGRCIVPIGRHSVHWGWMLRGKDVDDPIVIESFLGASRAACSASYALADWHNLVIGLNLEAIGAAWGATVPLPTYLRRVAACVDRMDRFREMCAYLDRRGREMVGQVERAAG